MNVRRIAPLVALAAALVAGSAAVATDPEPQRPRDRMVQALESLSAHAQNARVKLKADVGGFGRGSTPKAGSSDEDLSRGGRIGRHVQPEREPMAGKPSACCNRNLEVIAERMALVEEVLVEYSRRAGEDAMAREKIAAMARHWKSIEESMVMFTGTDSRDAARSAIGAAIGAIADLERAHVEFLDCCGQRPGRNQQ